MGTGDAWLTMRASPFPAIVSHCQPTFTLTGPSTDGVAQLSTTSRPCVESAVPSAAGADVHVHCRPFESVTMRSDMVVPPFPHDRA